MKQEKTHPYFILNYIVKYDKNKCDMSDPDVQKCRGLVLSKATNRVVCPVPTKSVSDLEFNQRFSQSPKITVFKILLMEQ